MVDIAGKANCSGYLENGGKGRMWSKSLEVLNPYEALMTKTVYVKSDYDPDTGLRIVRNVDGDIIFKISGNGEMRIATSGGKFHGRKLGAILKASEALIDALLMEEE